MEIKLKSGIKIVPEFIQEKGQRVVKDYIKYLEAEDTLENYPDRRQTVNTLEGEVFVIDCILFPAKIKEIVNSYTDDKAETETIWLNQLKPVWDKLRELKLAKGRCKKRYTQKINKGLTQKQLLEVYKDDLIERFGKWKSLYDTREYALNKWGVSFSEKNLSLFANSYQVEIDKLRSTWEKNIDGFKLSKKRGRLESLSELYIKNKEEFDKKPKVDRSRECRAIIEQVRKEIEGNKIFFDINQNIDVNITLNTAMSMKDLMSHLSINNLVIAMVSAKAGLNPLSIMSQLDNSYYRQANGVGGVLNKGETIEPPTQLIYDWNEIKRTYKTNPDNNMDYIEYEDIKEDKVLNKKEQLLKKLKG